MTKIKFKKKKYYPNLILGIIWVVLGLVDAFVFDDKMQFFNYIYLGVGLLFLSHFLYDLKYQYLMFKEGAIQKNLFYGGWNKKIKFEDICSVEKSYLNFILKTKSEQLTINADLIDDESYIEFKSVLKKLNLPEDKMPTLY